MSKNRRRHPSSAARPANTRDSAPSESTPGDQPVQSGMLALVSLIVLPVSIALAIWVGKDLYAIVFQGEICRPHYGCKSWSSNPVSLGVQSVGFTLLTTIFLGLAYGALKALSGWGSDDRA